MGGWVWDFRDLSTFLRYLSDFLRDLKTGSQARILRFFSPCNSVFLLENQVTMLKISPAAPFNVYQFPINVLTVVVSVNPKLLGTQAVLYVLLTLRDLSSSGSD